MEKKALTLELLLRDEVQQLLDNFGVVMKLQVLFFSAGGEIVRRSRGSGNSAYCKLMQQRVFGLPRCVALDAKQLALCAKKNRLTDYRCHAGLAEAIAPLSAQGRIVGFVMLGQFRTELRLPEATRRAITDAGLLREVEAAYAALPYIAPDEVPNFLGLFQMLVDYIVARELVALQGDRLLERFNRYLDAHLTEAVRLPGLARLLGVSVSGLTHRLKTATGKSFKNILIEKRLRHAERLLTAHPEMTIGEAAAASGFPDRFYFSRIYRKYRGCAPAAARRVSLAAPRRENVANPTP